MMAVRDAILEGTLAAQRLHAQLATRASFERTGLAHIDVFGVATELGAFLLFRSLKGLLGAYLGRPLVSTPGIIITTQRSLHVQRFTTAHEIGHMLLEHQPSYDEQVGLWRGDGRDLQEVAADAFASEFLLPRWLYIYHAKRQSWNTASLRNPDVTYQLALRLGASYDATCWGLHGHKILESRDLEVLRAIEPKTLKAKALGGLAELTNSWADVWVITEHDNGLTFQGGPDDIVIFRCRERASGGYLWDESSLERQGLVVVADSRERPRDEDECGGDVVRTIVTRVTAPGEYRVSMSERRPWDPRDAAGKIELGLDFRGKEEGLARHVRKSMIAA